VRVGGDDLSDLAIDRSSGENHNKNSEFAKGCVAILLLVLFICISFPVLSYMIAFGLNGSTMSLSTKFAAFGFILSVLLGLILYIGKTLSGGMKKENHGSGAFKSGHIHVTNSHIPVDVEKRLNKPSCLHENGIKLVYSENDILDFSNENSIFRLVGLDCNLSDHEYCVCHSYIVPKSVLVGLNSIHPKDALDMLQDENIFSAGVLAVLPSDKSLDPCELRQVLNFNSRRHEWLVHIRTMLMDNRKDKIVDFFQVATLRRLIFNIIVEDDLTSLKFILFMQSVHQEFQSDGDFAHTFTWAIIEDEFGASDVMKYWYDFIDRRNLPKSLISPFRSYFDLNEMSALYVAVVFGSSLVAETILNIKDFSFKKELYQSVRYYSDTYEWEKESITRMPFREGGEVRYEITPLMISILNDDVKMTEILIKHGAPLKSKLTTPGKARGYLNWALECQSLDTLKTIIESHPRILEDILQYDEMRGAQRVSDIVFELAIMDRYDLLQCLLKGSERKGLREVWLSSHQALEILESFGEKKFLEFINMLDVSSRSALVTSVLRALCSDKQKKCEIDQLNSMLGTLKECLNSQETKFVFASLLMEVAVAKFPNSDDARVIEMCLINGADPNTKGDDGIPVLAKVLNSEYAKILIAYGANVNARFNNESILQFHLRGANHQTKYGKSTNLIINVAEFGHIYHVCDSEFLPIINMLIDGGASVTERINGKTILQMLLYGDSCVDSELVACLIKKGAELHVEEGLSLFALSLFQEDTEVGDILLMNGLGFKESDFKEYSIIDFVMGIYTEPVMEENDRESSFFRKSSDQEKPELSWFNPVRDEKYAEPSWYSLVSGCKCIEPSWCKLVEFDDYSGHIWDYSGGIWGLTENTKYTFRKLRKRSLQAIHKYLDLGFDFSRKSNKIVDFTAFLINEFHLDSILELLRNGMEFNSIDSNGIPLICHQAILGIHPARIVYMRSRTSEEISWSEYLASLREIGVDKGLLDSNALSVFEYIDSSRNYNTGRGRNMIKWLKSLP